MSVDVTMKRFFPLILLGLLGITAYFQASGLGQLVAATVAEDSGTTAPPSSGGSPLPLNQPRKSGGAILARNPFDSVTGPLDGTNTPPPPPPAEEPVADGETSDEDPACGFGKVILISASPDPSWSFASIDDGKEGAKLRRVGDEVGTHTVQAMGWDRVWLTEGSKRCQMKLGEQGTASPPKTATPAPRRGSSRFALKPELAAKITKVSDDEYNIERSLVDELLQDQASLMRSARVAPNKDGGGVRLSRIRPGTLLDHLGLKTGDTLQTINGFDLSDPQKALEAYGRLRTASNLEVSVVRGGSPKTIRFNIQ